MFSAISIFLCALIISESTCLDFSYHHYDEITILLQKWNNTVFHPKLHVNLYTIGKSLQGRELWVMEITAGSKDITNLPNVKLIGNLHGNEAVGKELLLHYIEFLLTSYSKDEEITWLLHNTRLHIMPILNPDGSFLADNYSEGKCIGFTGRENALNIDLNRNFPDYYKPNNQSRQPETTAVMQWLTKIPFVLSASLHGGSLVASYPFNTKKNLSFFTSSRPPSLTPDNDVFVYLANTYATNHNSMSLGKQCPGSKKKFAGGIVNGAVSYSFIGGMGDYNYFQHGCMELTLGISCCKYPNASELSELWIANKKALIQYSLQANQGISGVVLDNVTKLPVNATLQVSGRDMIFNTTSTGRFWRLLLPGSYNLTITSDEYYSAEIQFQVQKPDVYPKLLNIEIYLRNLKYLGNETNLTYVANYRNTSPSLELSYFIILTILTYFLNCL